MTATELKIALFVLRATLLQGESSARLSRGQMTELLSLNPKSGATKRAFRRLTTSGVLSFDSKTGVSIQAPPSWGRPLSVSASARKSLSSSLPAIPSLRRRLLEGAFGQAKKTLPLSLQNYCVGVGEALSDPYTTGLLVDLVKEVGPPAGAWLGEIEKRLRDGTPPKAISQAVAEFVGNKAPRNFGVWRKYLANAGTIPPAAVKAGSPSTPRHSRRVSE